MKLRRCVQGFAASGGGIVWPGVAAAHLKWFEPYDVSTKPVPVADTLALPAFWAAFALVAAVLLAVGAVEHGPLGRGIVRILDRLTSVPRAAADRLMICTIGALFVALFAGGTTILTPELVTSASWVGWVQLGIAACLLFSGLYAVSALGIVVLWGFALVKYDLFHMLDYLALDFGLAGYLVLAARDSGRWHGRRFDVLRWGVAIAMMWASLEKFSYPAWYVPLLEKKPYLALGLPFATFTTISGVAEFALGFGLVWSPLVRRLSALALLGLILAAVFPFGRVDLIGHAPILMALFLVVAGVGSEPRFRPHMALSPVGLGVALAVFLLSQDAVHDLIYGDDDPSWLPRRADDEIRPGDTLPPHPHLFENEADKE
jgi:hypothetical protein